MVIFAIDRIPSLADRAPYASYLVLEEGQSDGVPVPIGDGGKSECAMPPPPRASKPLVDFDKTLPLRRRS